MHALCNEPLFTNQGGDSSSMLHLTPLRHGQQDRSCLSFPDWGKSHCPFFRLLCPITLIAGPGRIGQY